jgi:GNAT superfamily N-acetyltransferase
VIEQVSGQSFAEFVQEQESAVCENVSPSRPHPVAAERRTSAGAVDACRVEVACPAAPALRDQIRAGLLAFNQARSSAFAGFTVTDLGEQPLDALAFDDTGRLVGGLLGQTRWDWLEIEALWVAESHRRTGIGQRLLREAEEAARARGCRHAYLRTYSFQARAFYERQGYRTVGELDGWPPGHRSYWMRADWPGPVN